MRLLSKKAKIRALVARKRRGTSHLATKIGIDIAAPTIPLLKHTVPIKEPSSYRFSPRAPEISECRFSPRAPEISEFRFSPRAPEISELRKLRMHLCKVLYV